MTDKNKDWEDGDTIKIEHGYDQVEVIISTNKNLKTEIESLKSQLKLKDRDLELLDNALVYEVEENEKFKSLIAQARPMIYKIRQYLSDHWSGAEVKWYEETKDIGE